MPSGVIFFLLFLTGSIFVQARIGENIEEIQSRHGAGKEIDPNLIIFTIEDFDVTMTFDKGKSIREVYTTRVGNNMEVRKMTDKEVHRILQIQAQGKSWLKIKDEGKESSFWVLADGSVYAHFLPSYNSVTFTAALKELPKSK